MPEPAAAPPGARFVMHVVVTITDPADGLGLEPISPPRMSRVFGAVLRKLVDDDPNSQADVGGWPKYESGEAPVDSDHDGMADEWERARGLDPKDGTDGAKDAGDGYSHLERYLNELAAPAREK